MPDTAVLNIINVNIDSIEAACTHTENCNTNISNAKTSRIKKETHGAKENSTNMDEDLKILTISMSWIVILLQIH